MRTVTQSEQRTFRRCAREHFFAYARGYRPVIDAEPLRFGRLWHSALEAYWKNSHEVSPSPLEAAQRVLRAVGDVDPFGLAAAEALLIGYDIRWQDERYEILAVEAEFSAPLINPQTGHESRTFVLRGKIDAIVRGRDDRVYIVEHKTSSEDLEDGSPYWQRLRIDSQVSTYYAGARALGYDVAGCIYDVVAKPQLRPSKATPIESRKYTKGGTLYANQRGEDETPDEYQARVLAHIAEHPYKYFRRGTVVRLEDEEREAAFDAWQTTRLIREAELVRRYPRNADACPRYGRMCSYFDVCTGAASIENTERFRQLDNPHQELSHGQSESA